LGSFLFGSFLFGYARQAVVFFLERDFVVLKQGLSGFLIQLDLLSVLIREFLYSLAYMVQ